MPDDDELVRRTVTVSAEPDRADPLPRSVRQRIRFKAALEGERAVARNPSKWGTDRINAAIAYQEWWRVHRPGRPVPAHVDDAVPMTYEAEQPAAPDPAEGEQLDLLGRRNDAEGS